MAGELRTSWSGVERIFNRKIYHYEGTIHEQVVPRKKGESIVHVLCPVSMEHGGYNGEERMHSKGERNLEMLLKLVDQGNATGYDYFQIGQSYRLMKQDETAIPYYEKALDLLTDTRLEYVKQCVVSYGYALINTKKGNKALLLRTLYEDYKDYADYLFLMGEIYAVNTMFQQSIEMFEQAIKAPISSVEGVNSYKAHFNCGRLYELTGNKEKAILHYGMCNNYNNADKVIEKLKANQ